LISPGGHAPRVLVIGYGNPLRGDDGFGPTVASRLIPHVDTDQVEVLIIQQLTPDLAEPVSRAARTILIDARVGDSPGEIHVEPVSRPAGAPVTYQHHVDPGVLFGAAQSLYGVTPDMTLITVEANQFDMGEGLSPAVAAAVDEAVALVLEAIHSAGG
jgi:hydrogenase maturation protease